MFPHTERVFGRPITPLCPTSAHLPAIHSSWPNGVAGRVHVLSGGSNASLVKLQTRYAEAGTHPFTMSILYNWNAGDRSHGRLVPPKANKMPFVLRYHPLFRHAFNRAIALVPPPRELDETFSVP